jgi:hypothetical protein
VLDPESTWQPSSGDWNNPLNWSPALVPNNVRPAVFAVPAGEPLAIFSDADAVTKGLRFDTTDMHSLGGQGSLTLESINGNAFIDVLQGHHELQLPVVLSSDLDVNVSAGATLEIDNLLNLNGRTLTMSGGGLLEINNGLNTGTGSIVLAGGTLGGVGQISGNVILNGGTFAPGTQASGVNLTGTSLPEPSAIVLLYGVFAFLFLGRRSFHTRVTQSGCSRSRKTLDAPPRNPNAYELGYKKRSRRCSAPLSNWFTLLGCLVVTFFASGTARADFLVGGATFTEIFQDDFSGIGISEGIDEATFLTDNGDGLDVAKWTWGMRRGSWGMRRAARIERDGGGSVLVQSNDGFPSGFNGNDDVLVSTRDGQLSALAAASQWGYEIAFTINEQAGGSPSSATASTGILTGKTADGLSDDLSAARDVSVVVRQGSSGLNFDLFHSTGLIFTAGGTLTPLATDLSRGQEFVLGVHRAADDQVNYYLDGTFVGTFPSNNNATPEVLTLGDASGLTHVDFSFNSYKVGTTPGGPPVTEFRWFRDSSGDWNASTNWMFGIPNNNQRTAIFGDAILADRTVLTTQPITVKAVQFDNINSYAITGPTSVNLEADTGNAAISVLQGSHEFQLDVNLLSPTDVDIAGGGELIFNNELNLNGKTLTKTGLGAMNVNNALTGGGVVDCQEGTCGGTGSILGSIVNSGGTVSPGNSPGVLQIAVDYNQHADGVLLMEIGGSSPGVEYDQLTVGGIAELAGGLDVTLIDGFQPAWGDSFDILGWGQLVGSFDDVVLPALSEGLAWDASQLYATGSLSVASVPEASTLALVPIGVMALVRLFRPR